MSDPNAHPIRAVAELFPDTTAWIRALVAAIPYAGGALDHLLFDKAYSIKMRNLETVVNALGEQLRTIEENSISAEWFRSEEALAAIKLLSEKSAYEPDTEKIQTLGRVTAVCGTREHADDPHKLSVLEHLSRLNSTQIKLLGAVHRTPAAQQVFSTAEFTQTISSVWIVNILQTIEKQGLFEKGTVDLMEEFEVLEALNVVRRVVPMGGGNLGFNLTKIGKRAAKYLDSIAH
ncbi:MAG: hypothetical protein M9913_24620 [Bryobacteraceae bacterium]|nr:hypothetical protein [Solibacteraceae bacterium]MCO5354018.1 hypothetical protein [Bryobacteraceae bacterium]